MLEIGSSHPAGGPFEIELLVGPTSGLTTGMFGLRIFNSTGVTFLPGTAPGTCLAPSGGALTSFTTKNCGAPTEGWYAVLTFTNTTIQNVFDKAGLWSGPTAPVRIELNQIYLLSDENLTGVGYTLTAYTHGSQAVEGEASL